jgi:hypothetical protein
MTLRTLTTVIMPSLLAGGLLFGSAFSDAQPRPPTPPTPPTAPTPPTPPTPPMPGHHGMGGGFTVNIHNGKVEISGLQEMVDSQIDAALANIEAVKGLPPEARAKLEKNLRKMKGKLAKRLSKLDARDLDQLDDELDQIGDELGQQMDEYGKQMEQYGQDMDKWGKQFEKNFAKNFSKSWKNSQHIHIENDSNDSSDSNDTNDTSDSNDSNDTDDDLPGVDVDSAMTPPPMVGDVRGIDLRPDQRQALKTIRRDSDAQVTRAKQLLDQASDNLRETLARPDASDVEVTRAIDAVTQQEAAIRKARILGWVNARRILDDSQRQRIEHGAHR